MPKKGYNITNIEKVFANIISSNSFPEESVLSDLKKEINEFFEESECVSVLFTKNTDNLFFGMVVMPMMKPEETLDIILDKDDVHIKRYYVEIDSKLFSVGGLTEKELTAILLHDIAHMILDNKAIEEVRSCIDTYFANKDEIISLKNSAQYTQLLAFAVKDTLIKVTSMRYKLIEALVNDRFMQETGYSTYLTSALGKIISSPWGISTSEREPKLVILDWTFRLYSNVKMNRIPAIDTLKESKTVMGSVLFKKEIDNVITSLNRIDTDIVQEANYITDKFLNEAKKPGLLSQLKNNGLKAIENDYYEYKIRIKNLETEDDALYTLRQINARLSLLRDYIDNNELDDKSREKWFDVLEQYLALRNELTAKKIWSKKQYGLWFDYMALDDEGKQYQ